MTNGKNAQLRKAILFGLLAEATEQGNKAAADFIENELLRYTHCYSPDEDNTLLHVRILVNATALQIDDRVLTASVERDPFDWYTPPQVDKILLPALPENKKYMVLDFEPIHTDLGSIYVALKIINKPKTKQ